MKIHPIIIVIATSLLLASNVAVAKPKHEKPGHPTKAPEISVVSGTSAIALLAGTLLLVGERTRTRRS